MLDLLRTCPHCSSPEKFQANRNNPSLSWIQTTGTVGGFAAGKFEFIGENLDETDEVLSQTTPSSLVDCLIRCQICGRKRGRKPPRLSVWVGCVTLNGKTDPIEFSRAVSKYLWGDRHQVWSEQYSGALQLVWCSRVEWFSLRSTRQLNSSLQVLFKFDVSVPFPFNPNSQSMVLLTEKESFLKAASRVIPRGVTSSISRVIRYPTINSHRCSRGLPNPLESRTAARDVRHRRI